MHTFHCWQGGGVVGGQSVKGEGRGIGRGKREKTEERRAGEWERAGACAKTPCKEHEEVNWTRAGKLLSLETSCNLGSLRSEHLAAQSCWSLIRSIFAQCGFSTQTNCASWCSAEQVVVSSGAEGKAGSAGCPGRLCADLQCGTAQRGFCFTP